MKSGAFVVALVGAESTGKSTLAVALARRLKSDGIGCHVVIESLRTFCDAAGRTPTLEEQMCIACEQSGHIEAAAADHEVVIADTTALMTAVYSDQVFGDTSMYPMALTAHRRANLTLLTSLDLAWFPDGLQRDGPHVRVPVDRKVRSALTAAGIAYQVITGEGERRTAQALRALNLARSRTTLPNPTLSPSGSWKHLCGRCGDGDCERQLFRRALTQSRACGRPD